MIDLHFEKSDYGGLRMTIMMFIVLAVVILTAVIALIRMIVKLKTQKWELEFMTSEEKTKFWITPISAILVVVMMMPHLWGTLKYSVFLPFESEVDAITVTGVIQDISPVKDSPRYYINNGDPVYFASLVTVKDQEYYFLTAKGLEEGMNVEINYLPRSHMVLDCIAEIPIEPEVEEPRLPIETATQEKQGEGTPLINYIAAIVTSLFIVMMLIYLFILKRRIKKRRQ